MNLISKLFVFARRNPNTNNFEIKFIGCFLEVVHKIWCDILKEQIKLTLEDIFDQSLSQMYWIGSLAWKHVHKHFRWVTFGDLLFIVWVNGALLVTSAPRCYFLYYGLRMQQIYMIFFWFLPNNVKKLLIADGFNNLARACYKIKVSAARSDYFRISWQETFT